MMKLYGMVEESSEESSLEERIERLEQNYETMKQELEELKSRNYISFAKCEGWGDNK